MTIPVRLSNVPPSTEINAAMRVRRMPQIAQICANVAWAVLLLMMARRLELSQIGVACFALAAANLIKTTLRKALSSNASTFAIQTSPADQLAGICALATRTCQSWTQVIVALIAAVSVALYFIGGELAVLVIGVFLAAEALLIPTMLLRTALAMRAHNASQATTILRLQTALTHLVGFGLLLVWPTPLVIFQPRRVIAPSALLALAKISEPLEDAQEADTTTASPRPPLEVAASITAELLIGLRLHADKFIVAALLGLEALGLYFIALNAGLAISRVVSYTVITLLGPAAGAPKTTSLLETGEPVTQAVPLGPSPLSAFSVSSVSARTQASQRALRGRISASLLINLPVTTIVAAVLHVSLPALLDARFSSIFGIAVLLSFLTVPNDIWTACDRWMRRNGQAQHALWLNLIVTFGLLLTVVFLAPFGIVALGYGYALIAAMLMIGATLSAMLGNLDTSGR
jgi:PST family polysaccharide transporter